MTSLTSSVRNAHQDFMSGLRGHDDGRRNGKRLVDQNGIPLVWSEHAEDYVPNLLSDEAVKYANSLDSETIEHTIKSLQDCWQFDGVLYRGQVGIAELSKELLLNGKSRTQDSWVDHYKQAKPKGEFHIGDMPLHHAIFTALLNQKDKPESTEAREFIRAQMRSKWLMTSTRIVYQPKGKDKVIHGFGTSEEYLLEEDIVNPNRLLGSADSKALEAILGSGDLAKVKEVYNYINRTNAYIWGVNSKPDSVIEMVAGFNANSGRANLNCDGSPANANPALGVRFVAQKNFRGQKK